MASFCKDYLLQSYNTVNKECKKQKVILYIFK